MPGFNILQISQVLLPHETLPRSASSVIFNFERTNLSRYVFGLRKAICGVWVTLLLQVTFVHANAPSLIHQKQYLTLRETSILG